MKRIIAVITSILFILSCNMNFINTSNTNVLGTSKNTFFIKSTTNPNEVKKNFLPITKFKLKDSKDSKIQVYLFYVSSGDLILNLVNGIDNTNKVANVEVKLNAYKNIIYSHNQELNNIDDIKEIRS